MATIEKYALGEHDWVTSKWENIKQKVEPCILYRSLPEIACKTVRLFKPEFRERWVGLITPAAREAARRRQVTMKMEEQMKEERRAQWMASLRPGSWLGEKRQMPWSVKENNIKCFPKHTLYLYLSKNPRCISMYIIS